jgi:hypothetical protein
MPPLRERAPPNPHFSGSPQNLINESITLIEECEKSFKISPSSRLNLGYTSSGL